MKCPICGGNTKVADVRHPASDETLRSRICAACGYLFHTIEFEAVSDSKFMSYWTKAYRPTTKYKKG